MSDIRSLSQRLASDEADLAISLVQDDLPLATIKSREYAERLLLESTPIAIKRLRQIASSGEEKPAVSASIALLSKSPATASLGQAAPSSPSFSLPPESLALLGNALAQFGLASLALPAKEKPAESPITYSLSEERSPS